MKVEYTVVACMNKIDKAINSITDNTLIIIPQLSNADCGKSLIVFDSIIDKNCPLRTFDFATLYRLTNCRNSYGLVLKLNLSEFNCKSVIELVKKSFFWAIELGSDKIIFPILPNRLTGSCLNLKGTSALISRTINNLLEGYSSIDLKLEVVFWSTHQAKNNLHNGLDIVAQNQMQNLMCS